MVCFSRIRTWIVRKDEHTDHLTTTMANLGISLFYFRLLPNNKCHTIHRQKYYSLKVMPIKTYYNKKMFCTSILLIYLR